MKGLKAAKKLYNEGLFVFENEKKKRKEVIRHDKSPFVEEMIVEKQGGTMKISRLKEENGMHVTSYQTENEEEFIKLFLKNIKLTFGITETGIETLNVLIWEIQNDAVRKNRIMLDKFVLEDYNKEKEIKVSHDKFKDGLSELVEAQIIARTRRMGEYFLNPNFIFNGDKIVFSNSIEKVKK